MIYYINEFLFKKKLKPLPEDEKNRIINTYKDKKKIPDYNTIDKAAYILCKYTPDDMNKFCNKQDTQKCKNDISQKIKYADKNDKDIDNAKKLLSSFGNDNLVILHNKSLKDGSIIYHKSMKKILYSNNDEISYNIVSWNDFLDDVETDIRSFDGYDIRI